MPILTTSAGTWVVAAGGGGSPTFTKTGNPAGQGGLGFGGGPVTFSSVSIGTATSDRIVIVVVTYVASGDVSSVSCDSGGGDITMTKAVQTTLASLRGVGIWYLAVSSGTTATFKVNGSGFVACCLEVGIGTGITAAPTATQNTGWSNPADDFTLTAITIPSGGFAVAGMGCDSGATRTWKNNYSLQYASAAGTDLDSDMALSTTAGSSAASVQRGNFAGTAMCVSAWGA